MGRERESEEKTRVREGGREERREKNKGNARYEVRIGKGREVMKRRQV